MVNGTLFDPSKYDGSKASHRDTCWFVGKFISVGCVRRLFGKLLGKLFTEISLSDLLEVDNGCGNFSELRACSIFAESSNVI